MTYTDYVKLDEKINDLFKQRKMLDVEIDNLRDTQRVAAIAFPYTFYVQVGDKMVYRSEAELGVRVVTPEVE